METTKFKYFVKMKTGGQILLWILCIFFGYKIYQSVYAPIEFKKTKQERFAKVINVLKDIRNSQEAHKSVKGEFANDFESLIAFVDSANYTITQQRDSSYMEFDKTYGIDMQREVRIIDTLGTVSVKDSLFKKDSRYKQMAFIPGGANNEKFEMKADFIEKSGYRAPVFEVKAKKNIVLFDQPAELVKRENTHNSVEEVNGTEIKVGSLNDVSSNGNWPPIYDKKRKN